MTAEHELSRFPPVLQLAGLALLGLYVLLSVLGRVSDRFEWLWDDPDDARSLEHVVGYTVVPALMFFTASVYVYLGWDAAAPLGGGWTVRQLTLGPVAAVVGLLTVAFMSTVQRRRGRATETASPIRALLPLVVMLAGMGLMAIGIFSLGRTLKKKPAEVRPRAAAAASSPGSQAPSRAGLPTHA